MKLCPWLSIVALLGLSALTGKSLIASEIYKWIDEQGRVQFSDKAPAKERGVQAETITIKPIANSIESPDVSVSDFLQNAQLSRDQARKDKASRDRPVVMYSTVWCGHHGSRPGAL